MPVEKLLGADRLSDEDRAKLLGFDEGYHPKIKMMAVWLESFLRAACRNNRDKGTGLVISGPCGTGKSHGIKRISRYLSSYSIDIYAAGKWARGGRIPEPCYAVWSKKVALDHGAFEDWFQDAQDSAWIILDDVGSEVDRFKSGEPSERLRRVLELARQRWMLISTNVPPDKWDEAFDGRCASRMRGMKLLDLNGVPDYRAAKGVV